MRPSERRTKTDRKRMKSGEVVKEGGQNNQQHLGGPVCFLVYRDKPRCANCSVEPEQD